MSIPMEVIEDILSRLPVKPLLQFRCVSPLWRDLIDSPNFVKLHLARSIEADSHLNVILCSDPRPHSAKLEPSVLSLDTTELHHHPLRDEVESEIQVWGSCNGLVLLSNESNTLALWNPSTREFMKLPSCKFRYRNDEYEDISNYQCRNKFGFGYDKSSDDYKVLNMMSVTDKRTGDVVKYMVRVYSLSSNSWRNVSLSTFYNFPYIRREPGYFAGGALHWAMGPEMDLLGVIVAFDLGTEKWGSVPIPEVEEFNCSLSLGCFRDSICLGVNYALGYIEYWVMREYGVKSSWSKLFSLVPYGSRPVYFPKSTGEVFMQYNAGLIWFDVENCKPWYESVNDTEPKYMKNIKVNGMNSFLRVAVYMESLVSISGFRRMKNEMKKNLWKNFQLPPTMTLPKRALENILSWLPAEHLLRFRCVSPLWRDLIDNPHFIKLHLSRSIETETDLSIILYNPGLQIVKFEPLSLSLEAKEVDYHPLRHNEDIIQVWGACNGLLCLSNTPNTIVLWNPTTRKYVTLPYSDCQFKLIDYQISAGTYGFGYGFGYDSLGDDYKVVRITDLRGDNGDIIIAYDVQVYSLKANLWHRVKNFTYFPYMMREPGQLASGALHWVMGQEKDKAGVIVAFDLHSEECRIVPGPRFEKNQCKLSVERYKESISLVYIRLFGSVDIWVMREYGVQESWTKLFRLDPYSTRPFHFFKNNGGLMQHGGKLFWFDTGDSEVEDDDEHENVKHIEVRGFKKFVRVEIFTGSLVPLGGFETNDERKSKKKKKNQTAGFLSKGFKLKL